MNRAEAIKQVIEIINAEDLYFPCCRTEINENSSFTDDMGWDSLDMIEGIMMLEEHLDVEIDDETCINWKTVGDVADYLSSGKV